MALQKLKKIWEEEFNVWSKRKITKDYIYVWADGVNVEIRLGVMRSLVARGLKAPKLACGDEL